MAQIQPPNTQVVRPQHLTQVGHEGNPVETCALAVVGTLDATNFYDCESASGPAVYPVIGSGSGGGGNEAPILPLSAGGGGGNCYQDECAVIFITGGVAPYSVATSAGVFTMNASGTGGTICADTPTGTGQSPGVAAYQKAVKFCCTFTNCVHKNWDCAGNIVDECESVGGAQCGLTCSCNSCDGCEDLSFCATGDCSCPGDPTCNSCCGVCINTDACSGLETYGRQCDLRSGQTCTPCQIQFQDPATVTVTDSNGSVLIFEVEWSVEE